MATVIIIAPSINIYNIIITGLPTQCVRRPD